MTPSPSALTRNKSRIFLLAAAAVAVLGSVILSGCTTATPADNWASPNQNSSNTRYVGGRINTSTVASLGVAWTADLNTRAAFGAMATQPLIVDGSVYVQDLRSNVYSYDLETGTLNWEHKFNSATVGPNGLTSYGGNIYGATMTDVFALNAKSGSPVWISKGLASAKGAGFTISPQAANGVVHISTAAQIGGGIVYALDAKTGKTLWQWKTIDPKTAVAAGKALDGGAWNAPLVKDGGVYWGIGNPYQTINQGIKTPSKGLYINSTVKLNAATGKLQWYNQAVPNDFYDWDMQISPIATTDSNGTDLVLDAGKHGRVYAFNPKSGQTVWKTNVGTHNGHDNDSIDALNGSFHPKPGYTVYPGTLGGVETNMAVADDTVYVTTVELPATYKDFNSSDPFKVLPDYATGTGHLTALNVDNGKVKWTKTLGSMPFGGATVSNNLVFVTTYDGNIYAFNSGNGDQEWTSKLPAGTNSMIAISNDTVIVPAGIPVGKANKTQLVAFRIGGLGQVGGATAPTEKKQSSSGAAAPAASGSQGAAAAPAAADGKAIFTQNCAGCHTLKAAGTSGTVGPNLDNLMPSAATVTKQVTNGGGGMPPFKGTLSPAEIAAVAKYVSSVAGK